MSIGGKYGRTAGGRKRRATRAQSLWSSGQYVERGPHAPAKAVNEFADVTPLNAVGCFFHRAAGNPDFL